MSKSLRKAKKQRQNQRNIQRVSKNLHLVGGKLDHNHIHSHAPISASEIEKLDAINPEYTKELLSIMKTSVDNDRVETEYFYAAVDKEQDNDKLAIQSNYEQKTRAARYAFSAIGIILFAGIGLIIYGVNIKDDIVTTAGATSIGVVLVGIAKAFLQKADKESEKE
eukprot:Anaeramoba_ignava/a94299_279.p1 GENE.a94299_279~~a94299_279.p1  ORF type:complete len:166 (+),score=35.76 a94299_279:351-848(+)